MKNKKQPAVPVSELREILENENWSDGAVIDSIDNLIDFYELKEPQNYTYEEFLQLKPKLRKRANKLIEGKIIYDDDGGTLNVQFYNDKIKAWVACYDFDRLKEYQHRIDPDYDAEPAPEPIIEAEKVKEPQYREFTFEEVPFDRPVRFKWLLNEKRRITRADENGVYIGEPIPYTKALEQIEFADECEDRTFGVKI